MLKNDMTVKSGKRRSAPGSSLGGLAMFTGIFSVILFISLIPMNMNGAEPSVISGLALFIFVFDICGIIVSIMALKENGIHYSKAMTGLVLCTCMFILMIAMYLIGL